MFLASRGNRKTETLGASSPGVEVQDEAGTDPTPVPNLDFKHATRRQYYIGVL